MKRLIPRIESLKIGPSTDPMADYGPFVTKAHLDKVKAYVDLGIKEAPRFDGRDFKMQGYENGFYMGGCLFDEVGNINMIRGKSVSLPHKDGIAAGSR